MNMKKAVIYCRVSDSKQVDGYSLVIQEKVCIEYALRRNYIVDKTFTEEGESAKTDNRTQLKNLLAYCKDKQNGISVVIFYKIDRWARQHYDYSDLKLSLRKYGVIIESATENITDTPVGRYMENMLASQAQFDNEIRAERCTSGMKEAVRQGRYVWMAPIGYVNTKVNDKATIKKGELAELVVEAFTEVAKNTYDTEFIRKILITKGLITRYRKGISANQFHLMLRNPLYKGVIKKFGMTIKGSFEPIISEELFDHVQLVLQRKGYSKWVTKSNNPDFPLRKFIVHPTGVKLTGSWSKGRKKMYPYYFFKNMRGHIYKKEQLEKEFCAFLSNYSIPEERFVSFREFVLEQFENETKDASVLLAKIKSDLAELEQREEKVMQKNLEGIFNDAISKKELDTLAEQKLILISYLYQEESKIQQVSIAECLSVVWNYIVEPQKAWLQSSPLLKSELQRFYFPLGIQYDGKKVRTTDSSIILKANSAFLKMKSYVVHPSFQNSNTLDIGKLPHHFEKSLLGKIEKEKYLQEIRMLASLIDEKTSQIQIK